MAEKKKAKLSKKSSSTKKVAKKAASKTAPAVKRVTVKDAWVALFVANEKVTVANKLTDAQLTAAMEKTFPDKKGRATLVRVSSVRSNYNAGRDFFAKLGVPKKASRRYDDDGSVMTRGRSSKATPAKKKVSKKKANTKKG